MNFDEISINQNIKAICNKKQIIKEALRLEICPCCGQEVEMDCLEPALICNNKECRMKWSLYSCRNTDIDWTGIKQLSPESGYYK